jgi:hypothetical protein
VQQEVENPVMMLIVLILGNLYEHHIMLGHGVPIVHIHEQWYKENHPGGILTETSGFQNPWLSHTIAHLTKNGCT